MFKGKFERDIGSNIWGAIVHNGGIIWMPPKIYVFSESKFNVDCDSKVKLDLGRSYMHAI